MNAKETAELRSYLASQSMRCTPAQLIDTLQRTRRQLSEMLVTLPDNLFLIPLHENEWSAALILAHVCEATALYERDICAVIKQGVRPSPVGPMNEPHLKTKSRRELLNKLETSCIHLSETVLNAAPDRYLDVTWSHFELGFMHWREWLLFSRVHMLEHVRQLQVVMKGMQA